MTWGNTMTHEPMTQTGKKCARREAKRSQKEKGADMKMILQSN